MNYVEPNSVDEVIKLLAADEDARCMAGGATLVAMMNADLVSPTTLIGLRNITELAGISETADSIRIGAMTTHTAIASDERLTGPAAVVRSAAGQIAHPAIRNQGTIGGSICHADPMADFPTALVAADAAVEVVGPNGPRSFRVAELFVDYLENSLEQGEVLSAIALPKSPANGFGHYTKLMRVEGDYATVSVAAVIAMEGKTCSYARVVIGSVDSVPLHLEEVDAGLEGSALSADDLAKAGAALAEAANPVDDVRGSGEYRSMVIPGLLARTVTQLKDQAVG